MQFVYNLKRRTSAFVCVELFDNGAHGPKHVAGLVTLNAA